MGKRRRPQARESNLLWAIGPGALLFAALVAAVWQFAQLQRSLDRQALLSSSAFAQHDRLLQLVNEESGVRGYVATGDERYLGIYRTSQRSWLMDTATVSQTQSAIPNLQSRVQRSILAADEVEQYFRDEIALVRAGRTAAAKHRLSRGKQLFDRLRALDAAVQLDADAELQAQRVHTRLLAQVGLTASIALCAVLLVWAAAFGLLLRRSKIYRLSALRDPLTGVQNRRGAIAAIEAEIDPAHPAAFGLVYIDLDGFKKINDVYGHATGDAILRGVAARLAGELRPSDTVCRMGGDEFACVIAPPAAEREVREISERLRKSLCRPYEIGGEVYVVGCSIGAGMYPQHGETAEALLACADAAMYAAKAAGGGVREATVAPRR